jgi:hypothetical protein
MGEYYVLMYANGKTRPVESIPGMGTGRQRRKMEGEIQLLYIVRTFVNATMYPLCNNTVKITI